MFVVDLKTAKALDLRRLRSWNDRKPRRYFHHNRDTTVLVDDLLKPRDLCLKRDNARAVGDRR
jgi:hypothetical protein